MPTAPRRVCPRCGSLLAPRQACRTCWPTWLKRHDTNRLDLSWPAVRRKVLDRDRGRCQLCAARATQVDHIVPRSEGGSDQPANLRSLCDYCHRVVTARHARAVRDRTVY
jgi:5-methylcytosine-specific restriction endonuclease McrA